MGPLHAGVIIHKRPTPEGDVYVVRERSTLSLHLDSGPVQSRMLITEPQRLVLSYTRAMMAFLLLRGEPLRVAQLGLGGGSLTRFFHHYFRRCSIDAVDSRPEVVDVAARFFDLPTSERLRLHVQPAQSFLTRALEGQFTRYDVLLVDLFDSHTPAACLEDDHFYTLCQEALTGNGILVINLWHGPAMQAALRALDAVFGNPALQLPVDGKGNVIVLAQCGPHRRLDKKHLRERARTLTQRYDIEFKRFAKLLWDSNPDYRRGNH
jgi:spermidine synthase